MQARLGDLFATLANVEKDSDAYKVLDKWADKLADDNEIANQLYENNLKANMAGSLFVAEIELPKVERKLDIEIPETFLNLRFAEAIQHFLDKEVLSPEEFYELQDAERFRSFTATRAVSDLWRERMKRFLDAAMEPGGEGLRSFVTRFASHVDSPLTQRVDETNADFQQRLSVAGQGYLETVYRTSTSTSYNAGRLTTQMKPSVKAAGYMWQYSTVNDNRVRDEHAALHGKVWEIGDPEALAVYPPDGYNCRCAIVVIHPDDVTDEALNRVVNIDDAITDGFRGPPTDFIEDPEQ